MNFYDKWVQVDALLAIAQEIVSELKMVNEDDYGCLESAYDNIVKARCAMEDDLK